MAAAILKRPPADRAAALTQQMEAVQAAIRTAAASDKARKEAGKVRDQRRIEKERTATALTTFEKHLAQLSSTLAEKRVARESASHARAESEKALHDSVEQLATLFDKPGLARQAWTKIPPPSAVVSQPTWKRSSASGSASANWIAPFAIATRPAPASEAVVRAQSDADAQRRRSGSTEGARGNSLNARRSSRRARCAEIVEKEPGDASRLATET